MGLVGEQKLWLWSWRCVRGLLLVSPPHPCHSREGGNRCVKLAIYQNFRGWRYRTKMNVQTGKLTGVEELDVRLVNFYQMRSEMLDSFAGIEQTLLTYVRKHNQKSFCITAPLGHKIEAAKKVPAGPRRSKELKAKADNELSKLAELLPLRADMVHSRMEIAVTTSSQFLAIFKNAKDVSTLHPEALVFDNNELKNFVLRVTALEKSLAKSLTAQNPQPKPKT